MSNILKVLILMTILLLLFTSCTSAYTSTSPSAIARKTDNEGTIWPMEKWSVSTPEEQGMDSNILSESDKRIKENYPNVYSLLVIRHGYLAYERYYQGMDMDSSNPVYSVTKSVMSALTGIALRDKLITSIDKKVIDYLPQYFKDIDDNRKKDITIRDVLTMSGGLETVDNDYGSYFSSRDWAEYALKKPLTDKPGTTFVYNTGLTHLLSGIISKTSKISTLDFANKNLFNYMGFSLRNWEMSSEGIYEGGTGLHLTPREMAKFGYLYLKKGMWDGKQVIPKKWVEESTSIQISPSPEVDYGYLFWIEKMKDKSKGKEYSTYHASGAGGQHIVVVPDLDMVAVVTANINQSAVDKADTIDIVKDYVIPAAGNIRN